LITVDGATAAALDAGRAYVVRPSITVLPYNVLGGGAEDLSHRCKACWVNASMDNPVMQASVSLTIGQGVDSLSPFIQASMHRPLGQPLAAPAAEVLIGFYIGTKTDRGELVGVFQGRADRVGVSSKTGLVTLQCRDLGAWWMNTHLRKVSILGSEGGTEASQVMQAIMAVADPDTELGFAAPGLLVTAPPDWMVLTYPQQPMPALEAMRIIAQQAGRDVRWFRSQNGLTYYEPNRAVDTPDLVIGRRRYESVNELSWGDEDVRNIWEIQWQNADSSFPDPITVKDAVSIGLYGPRFARVFLNRADNIRSLESATLFANAALADSKDPFASHAIQLPLEPRVELNDYHRYLANFREYDEDMSFAVAAFRHDWQAADARSPGVMRTTIGARAKPIAAYRDYRRSIPPKVLVSTLPIPDALWAPEGTLGLQVDSLAVVP